MLFLGRQGVTGERREELTGGVAEVAPMCSPASKSRFHNFSFPTMSWGCQWILRCVKPASGIDSSATRLTTPDTLIEPQREGNTSYSPVSLPPMSRHAEGSKEKEAEQENASSAAAKEAAVHWNMRKRRAASYVPSENGKNQYPCSSPSNLPLGKDNPCKATIRRSVISENGRRREFSISLTRKEMKRTSTRSRGRNLIEDLKRDPRPCRGNSMTYSLPWDSRRLQKIDIKLINEMILHSSFRYFYQNFESRRIGNDLLFSRSKGADCRPFLISCCFGLKNNFVLPYDLRRWESPEKNSRPISRMKRLRSILLQLSRHHMQLPWLHHRHCPPQLQYSRHHLSQLLSSPALSHLDL